MTKKHKLKWELIDRESDGSDIVSYRAKVQGGWLVSVWAERLGDGAKGLLVPGGSNWGGGLTFVPDAHHEWKVDVIPTPRD